MPRQNDRTMVTPKSKVHQDKRGKSEKEIIKISKHPRMKTVERVSSTYMAKEKSAPSAVLQLIRRLRFKTCIEVLREINKGGFTDKQKIALIQLQQVNRNDVHTFHRLEVLPAKTPMADLEAMTDVALGIASQVKTRVSKRVEMLSGFAYGDQVSSAEGAACTALDDMLARLTKSELKQATTVFAKGLLQQTGNALWGTGALLGSAALALGSKVWEAVKLIPGQFLKMCLYILRSPRAAVMSLIALHACKRHICVELSHLWQYGVSSAQHRTDIFEQEVAKRKQNRNAMGLMELGMGRVKVMGGNVAQNLGNVKDHVWDYAQTVGPQAVTTIIGNGIHTSLTHCGKNIGTWTSVAITAAVGASPVGATGMLVGVVGSAVGGLISDAFGEVAQVSKMAAEQTVHTQEVSNAMGKFVVLLNPKECLDIYNSVVNGSGEREGGESAAAA